MSRTNLIELHAREKAGVPEWQAYFFACMPPTRNHLYFEVRGGVYPPVASGPRKGKPNWKKPVAGTERTLYIPVAEHDAWVAEWERTTGNCSECVGTGERIASVSKAEGQKMRPCRACGGTGKVSQTKKMEADRCASVTN